MLAEARVEFSRLGLVHRPAPLWALVLVLNVGKARAAIDHLLGQPPSHSTLSVIGDQLQVCKPTNTCSPDDSTLALLKACLTSLPRS